MNLDSLPQNELSKPSDIVSGHIFFDLLSPFSSVWSILALFHSLFFNRKLVEPKCCKAGETIVNLPFANTAKSFSPYLYSVRAHSS